MPKKDWQTLNQQIVHENPWYRVRHDRTLMPSGAEGNYFVVERAPTVAVVAITNSLIATVGLWRYPVDRYSIELPAGSCEDDEPLAAAKRELWEETGLESDHWRRIGGFDPMNGLSDETSHVFLADRAKWVGGNGRDARDEGIQDFSWRTLPEIIGLIHRGAMQDAMSICAIMLLAADTGLLPVQ